MQSHAIRTKKAQKVAYPKHTSNITFVGAGFACSPDGHQITLIVFVISGRVDLTFKCFSIYLCAF